MTTQRIKQNILLVLGLNFAWTFLVIQAILIPLYSARGLSPTQILSISTAFSVTLLLLDVPTGYLADRFSRRGALICAGLFKGLGGTVLVVWQTYPGFIAAFVLIGIGNSLFSGADLALLYEYNSQLIERQADPQPFAALLSRRLSMIQLGAALSAIMGGIIATTSFDRALVLNCVIAWLSLAIALCISEPVTMREKTFVPHLARIGSILRLLTDRSTLLVQLLVARIWFLAILLIHGALLQMYWQYLRVPLAWFGLLWALHSLISIALAWLVSAQKLSISKSWSLWLLLFLPTVGFLGTALSSKVMIIGIAFGLLFEIFRVLVSGQLNAQFNELVPREHLATVNSVASMGSRILFSVAAPLIGLSSETYGLPPTLGGLGLACLAVGGIFVTLRLWLNPGRGLQNLQTWIKKYRHVH